MRTYTLDKLGRRKFTPHSQKPRSKYKLTKHKVRALQFLLLHGFLSSDTLFEAGELKDRHNFQELLLEMFDEQLVYKPIAQRLTEYPDGNFHVYGITERGEQALKDNKYWFPSIRPRSSNVAKFPHDLMVATITATIHIMCERNSYRYIGPYEYLDGREMKQDVTFDFNGTSLTKKLCPDSVFAIDYGDNSYIAFFLEADRNTETGVTNNPHRKSHMRELAQYRKFIGGKLYKEAYGRDAMAVLLHITTGQKAAENFVSLIPPKCPYVAVGYCDAFADPFEPPKLPTYLFTEGLMRQGYDAFTIQKT